MTMNRLATWPQCRKIICIRPDNLGDVMMTVPALRALKETFGCHITLLTSTMAQPLTPFLDVVDDSLIFDVPWVKSDGPADVSRLLPLIDDVRQRGFDGAIVFTTFSQNAVPSAMVAYLAGIPLRLAYCRENPYHLLTHWIPDEEPYTLIRHQVRRDLELVKSIGARPAHERLTLDVPSQTSRVMALLQQRGVDLSMPWLVMHPGVSEAKRQFPLRRWIDLADDVWRRLRYQVIVTGTKSESGIADAMVKESKARVYSLAGALDLAAFVQLIALSPVIVSVNTATVHLAAAVQTKVVVLYAATNPQHTPWQVHGRVLPFDVPPAMRSKNEVLRFVREKYFPEQLAMPGTEVIMAAIVELLESGPDGPMPPEIINFNEYVYN